MKRSFHITSGLYLGGVETVIMSWYRNISLDFQFDFGVHTLKDAYFADEIKKRGGRIFVLEKNPSLFGRIVFMFRLYKTLKKNGPYTAFFAHEQYLGALTCFVAFLAGIKKRIIVSHWITNYNTSKLRAIIFMLLTRLFTTHRLAVSKEAGFAQYGKKLSFQVVNNGIDIGKFAFNKNIRQEVRKNLNIKEETIVIGNVSRLSEDKNLFFLLDIFKEIHTLNQNTILLQAGYGVLEKELKSYAKKLKIENNVLWLGKYGEVSNIYQALDVFVFPAKKEGLGIVAIEAQCSGLPCFISDGVPDEANVCNTTKISLKESSVKWAEVILNKLNNFNRIDCSNKIKNAGFDIKETAKRIEQEYLQ